jgi:SAM-dependent methyltransferase
MSEIVERYWATGTLGTGRCTMKLLRRLGLGVWSSWPEEAYRQNRYHQRLLTVQEHLAECLDVVAQGPVRILSICAGDGRDVVNVIGSHPRRTDVCASLVELDGRSVAAGKSETARAGLTGEVHFFNADATVFETYASLPSADIVLLCGVWGHVPTDERLQLVRGIAALCKPGGKVIWTRGVSQGLIRFDEIRSVFARAAWEMVRVSITSDNGWAVVTSRYRGRPSELPANGRMFHFRRSSGHGEVGKSPSRFSTELFRKVRRGRSPETICEN